MDDRVGPELPDRLAHRRGVEQVQRDRLGAGRPHPPGVPGRAERTGDLVPALGQLGHEADADGAARSHDQDSHDRTPLYGLRTAAGMTPEPRRM